MRPEVPAAELAALVEEAGTADVRRSGPANERWKAKAEAVMGAALGSDSATLSATLENEADPTLENEATGSSVLVCRVLGSDAGQGLDAAVA
jgi:hypothetical protein